MAEAESKNGEKKSSKKLIFIILIVLLLAGGGAGGYFYFMQQPDDAKSEASNGKASKKEKEKEKEAVEEPKVYYDLSDPLLVNFPPGSSAKIIKLSVSVLVTGEANMEQLKKHEPMIRNNLLMAISSLGADKAKTEEGKKELQAMMLSEIGKVMEKMTHGNPVKDVFFTEFVMQ